MKLRFSESGDSSERPPQSSERPARPKVLPEAPFQVPDSVLQRHGARILRPAEAVRLPGAPPPRPTVYRYGTLLIPQDLLHSNAVPMFNEALAEIGLTLVRPQPLEELVGRERAASPAFATLPRPVGLAVAKGRAATVDAWTALQALWGAVSRGRASREAVSRIGLEHLLAGSALAGVGTVNLTGTNIPTQGSPDTGGLFNGPRPGLSGRIPVEVVLSQPRRPQTGELGTSRRPIIAVLDTGIGDHPWFDSDIVDRAKAAPGDQFLIVDSDLQGAIYGNGVSAAATSNTPMEPINGYRDQPSIREPLVGEIDTHYGHGTFIAGIIRQVAPAAQVFSIRVMHPDGFAHESDVLLALAYLTDDMGRLQAGDSNALPVDLVSLSLGFFPETPYDISVRDSFATELSALTATGVTTVAAAGNFSTSREFHPAALAGQPAESDHAPIISVGALNPNGTVAHFSDEAPWVSCYAPGTAMVSTFPTAAGAVSPEEATVVGNHRRESFDPDDFTGGFAVWSGTSFATPLVAAELANALVANASADPEQLGLGDTGQPATVERARHALESAKLKALESLKRK
jgi:subtilisin family serine protease